MGEEAPHQGIDLVVYEQLLQSARGLLRRHQRDSVSPSSLIHDAFLRLEHGERERFRSRDHYLAAASLAMRHILFDRSRKKDRDKHGEGWLRVTLSGLADDAIEIEVESLDAALERLAGLDARGAEIVQMRFFGGMTIEAIAGVLELNPRTVDRDWRAARAWLKKTLGRD